MQTKSSADIESKLWNRICRIQMKTGKRIHECISSISISYDDYHILSRDPTNSIAHSIKHDEWRGIKFRLTRKMTRVNTRWPDQSKYSNRVKRSYKKAWTKVVFPSISNSSISFPRVSNLYGSSQYGDQVQIDHTFQFNKPIDHMKVDLKVTV